MNFSRRLDAIYFLAEMCKNIDTGGFISLCIEREETVCSSLYKTRSAHASAEY